MTRILGQAGGRGGTEITVGTYADWVATKRSDHVPIIVDMPSRDMLTATVVPAS